MNLKRFHDARVSYERALRIAPDCPWVYGSWLLTKMQLCDWTDVASQITTLADGVEHNAMITPPFPVLALIDSPSVQRKAAQTWVIEKHPQLIHYL